MVQVRKKTALDILEHLTLYFPEKAGYIEMIQPLTSGNKGRGSEAGGIQT